MATCHHCGARAQHWVLYHVYSHARGHDMPVRLCERCVLDHAAPGRLAEKHVMAQDQALGVEVAARWYRAM